MHLITVPTKIHANKYTQRMIPYIKILKTQLAALHGNQFITSNTIKYLYIRLIKRNEQTT